MDRWVSCGRVGLSRLETRGTSGRTDAEAAGDCWTSADSIERENITLIWSILCIM